MVNDFKIILLLIRMKFLDLTVLYTIPIFRSLAHSVHGILCVDPNSRTLIARNAFSDSLLFRANESECVNY